MHIINARLRNQEGLHELNLENGLISSIGRQIEAPTLGPDDLDAGGNLVVPPFVEPHIHLDATLTAGEPRWNMSGTLFEGIECWGERKATITQEDTKARAKKTIQTLAAHGIQHVRTHVDVTDPQLTALKAMLEVREESRHLVDLQIVAPHFEYTRDQGVSSVKFLMDLAERSGCLVDVHCDETDDPHSRFLEVLAEEARSRDMGSRVTASHTTAMGSYDNAYCAKLFRLLGHSGISFVSCPTESIHLQGRFDSFPKRRGVTRVNELLEAGMNVCFGQDSIVDPWYPLGNGNILRVLEAGLHICHMLGYRNLQSALDLVTDNSAKAMNLGDRYGLERGRPANLLILSAESDYEVIRSQGLPLYSVRDGKVLMKRTMPVVEFAGLS
ncbi:MAG: amidohydrolase family protein [Pseudomonas fluorescens]|nr:amidohydrolase family protein [Pseudomonas fluorescens]